MLGRWLDRQCQKMRHVSTGSLDKALHFCRRARASKSACAEQRPLPVDPEAGDGPAPSRGSGQGTHSSRLARWNKRLWERRETGRGSQGAFQPKPEQNGVAKTSSDGKDVLLLSTAAKTPTSLDAESHRTLVFTH